MDHYRYREAYPRMDVVKAKAAFDRGQTVCRFFDERNYEEGEALILSWGDATLYVETSGACFRQTSQRAGWTDRMVFRTVVAARNNNTGKPRTYLVCPTCQRPFGILIYKGKWGCGGCLELGYRSQFVPPDVFASVRRAALQETIGRGRPRCMRQTAYRKAVEELAALKPRAGSFPSVPSVAHQRVVRAKWLTPAEAGHLLHSDFVIVDGEIKPADWRKAEEPTREDQPPRPAPPPVEKHFSMVSPVLDPLTDEDVFNQGAPFHEP